MTGSGSHVPIDCALKTGPPLVGIILNLWLFGLSLMQYCAYCFHSRDPAEKKWLRIVVCILFALDTTQTVMTIADGFQWFVYGFGDYDAFRKAGTSTITSAFMDGLIGLIVQLLYCWWFRTLSSTNWTVLPRIIAFLAFIGGVSGMVAGACGRVVQNLPPNATLSRYYPFIVVLWLWVSVVTDILVAASMFCLMKQPAKSENTKVATKRIVILTLGGNFLTIAVAMATAIMFVIQPLAPPATNVHMTGAYILGKLHSNCFMVSLNQRVCFARSNSMSPGRLISAQLPQVNNNPLGLTLTNPLEHCTEASENLESGFSNATP